jgi:hypothetical protein
LRSLIGVVATTLITLGLTHWLVVVKGVAEPLVPGPDRVVERFVGVLSTRPAQALPLLAPDLREHTTPQDLEQLDHLLRARYRSYRFLSGGREVREGDEARYAALVEVGEGQPLRPVFELRRDRRTGLWQISSLKSLRNLAQPVPGEPTTEALISI